MNLILPRKDSDGNYYISYSQVMSFLDNKSFNLGIEGKLEYIRSYFFEESFPDAGWAQFGLEVEDYICSRQGSENFTNEEINLLNEVVPLGNFQREIKIPLFENVYVKGFIDDANNDLSWIRDYKTASKTSAKKYYKPEYVQLLVYAEGVKQITGSYPKKIEVCIIERNGNCFGKTNGRGLLSVGNEVWYHDIELDIQKIKNTIEIFKSVVIEISEIYKLFLKLKNGK